MDVIMPRKVNIRKVASDASMKCIIHSAMIPPRQVRVEEFDFKSLGETVEMLNKSVQLSLRL